MNTNKLWINKSNRKTMKIRKQSLQQSKKFMSLKKVRKGFDKSINHQSVKWI